MRSAITILCAAAMLPALHGQTDWPVYGGDLGNTRYSPLSQITAANVSKLAQAWVFDTRPTGSNDASRPAQATPLVVNGVMYMITAHRTLVALDPETGKQIWAFSHKHNGRPP